MRPLRIGQPRAAAERRARARAGERSVGQSVSESVSGSVRPSHELPDGARRPPRLPQPPARADPGTGTGRTPWGCGERRGAGTEWGSAGARAVRGDGVAGLVRVVGPRQPRAGSRGSQSRGGAEPAPGGMPDRAGLGWAGRRPGQRPGAACVVPVPGCVLTR